MRERCADGAGAGGFSAFTGGHSHGLGVSPKDVGVGVGMGMMGKGGESPPGDMATKQCVCLLFSYRVAAGRLTVSW